MSDLLKAALAYRKRGWSVIPLNPASKKPLVAWGEFQSRIASRDEIRQWWANYPDANVGVVTGAVSNLVVVDVEAKAVQSQGRAIHEEFGTDTVGMTGGGGFHLYYSYPDGNTRIPNSVNKSLGIDVRAEGGIVVAPPSSHRSGRPYTWRTGPTGNLPVISPVLLARVAHHADPSTPGGYQDAHWLSRTLAGLGAGERNDGATRLAGYWCSKQMPEDVVLDMMQDWNLKNDPPLRRKEIEIIVSSVWRTSRRRIPVSTSKPRIDIKPNEAFGVTPFIKYLNKYGDSNVPWAVEGWLPDKTIAMVVAPPGSFKTWMLLDLAVSVASGKAFLGKFKVERTGPVIIVQQEDFHGQMAERLGLVTTSKFDIPMPNGTADYIDFTMPPDLPIFLHPDRRLRFDDPVVMEAFSETIADIKPALVIIDPLYTTGRLDDFMASAVENMLRLKSLRDEYGCSFLLAHHTKKRSEGSEREDAWGTQFLNAFLETGWQVRRKNEKAEVQVRRHFKARSDVPEEMLSFKISSVPPYSYLTEMFPVPTGKEKSNAKTGEIEMDIIGVLADKGSLTAQQLAVEFKVNKSTVIRRLKRLEDAEMVARNGLGQYSRT